MFRFTKMILIASLVLGIFAFVAVDDADAGYGWGCYRGSSYSSACYYRPAYNYCNTYSSPTIYRSSYCGFPSYRSYPRYNSCYGGYGGYGYGGYGGYGYGGYGHGGYGGYCVPTSYGQFNW